MRFNPYLTFPGTCEEAFRFYETVLGGRIQAMMRAKDTPVADCMPAETGDMIMHVCLEVGGLLLMGSDAPPQRQQKPQGLSVCIQAESPEEAERLYAALADGAEISMPLGETFWAHRFGMLTDRYGTPWMINCSREG